VLGEQRAEDLRGPRPEGTEALLSALAAQPRLKRAHELEVRGPQVEDLLDAGAGVEEREQEGVISTAVGRCPIGRVQNCGDLIGFEILDDARSCSLERDGEDPLAELQVLRMIRGDEPRECVDGSKPRISCRYAVAAGLLEIVQERNDVVGRQVAEVERDDGPAMARREKSEEKRAGVAVAGHRVWTHPANPRQIVGKELAQCAGQGTRRPHRILREVARILRQCASNRALAAAATGSSIAR
jgi:hypothetical protein